MIGDMNVGMVTWKIDVTTKTTKCVPHSDTTTTDIVLCTMAKNFAESVLGGTIDFNADCGPLETVSMSSAAGLGFGAFLVTIVYMLH